MVNDTEAGLWGQPERVWGREAGRRESSSCFVAATLISFPLALLLTITPSANNHRACRMPETLYQATCKSDISTLVITLLQGIAV